MSIEIKSALRGGEALNVNHRVALISPIQSLVDSILIWMLSLVVL
jgi:hypothetical protein